MHGLGTGAEAIFVHYAGVEVVEGQEGASERDGLKGARGILREELKAQLDKRHLTVPYKAALLLMARPAQVEYTKGVEGGAVLQTVDARVPAIVFGQVADA